MKTIPPIKTFLELCLVMTRTVCYVVKQWMREMDPGEKVQEAIGISWCGIIPACTQTLLQSQIASLQDQVIILDPIIRRQIRHDVMPWRLDAGAHRSINEECIGEPSSFPIMSRKHDRSWSRMARPAPWIWPQCLDSTDPDGKCRTPRRARAGDLGTEKWALKIRKANN